MAEIETVRITNPVLAELFKTLYGQKTYKEISGALDLWDTKKQYLKIFKSMRFAIEETIQTTDKTHIRKIEDVLVEFEELIKKSRTHSEVDQVMITFQTVLFFKVLGDFSTRGEENDVINSHDKWKLNRYRQIQFTQDKEQKRNLIFSVIQEKFRDRFPDWENFVIEVYLQQCNKEPDRFIAWLAKHHPDIYISIF